MAILLLDQQKRLINSQPNEDRPASCTDNVASEVLNFHAALIPSTNFRQQHQQQVTKAQSKENCTLDEGCIHKKKSHSVSVIRTRSLRGELIQKLNYKDKMDSQQSSPLNNSGELRLDNVDKQSTESDGSASPIDLNRKFHSDSSTENLSDRNLASRRLISTEIFNRRHKKTASIRSNVLSSNVLPDMKRKLMQSHEKASSSDNLHTAAAALDSSSKLRSETSTSSSERHCSGGLFFGSMEQLNCVSSPIASSTNGHVSTLSTPTKKLSHNDSEDVVENAEVIVLINRKLGLPPRSRSTNTLKKSSQIGTISIPQSVDSEVTSTAEIVLNHHEDNVFEDDATKSNGSHQVENLKIPIHLSPSIRHQKSPISGSPPKQVTFVLEPDVKTFEITGENEIRKQSHSKSKSARSNKSSNPSGNHHDDVIIPVPNSASISMSNSTLMLLHERHMEQITWLMKEEMTILENVKQQKFSIDEYRTVLSKLISVKAKVVENMQNLMKKSDFNSNS